MLSTLCKLQLPEKGEKGGGVLVSYLRTNEPVLDDVMGWMDGC